MAFQTKALVELPLMEIKNRLANHYSLHAKIVDINLCQTLNHFLCQS